MTEFSITREDLRREYDWLCAFFPEKSNLIATVKKELELRDQFAQMEKKALLGYGTLNLFDPDCL